MPHARSAYAGYAAAVTFVLLLGLGTVHGQMGEPNGHTGKGYVKFNDKGELIRPTDYRAWPFVGAPVTPNDMNNGKAAFPEFHIVYIDPDSYEHYKKTGEFRENAILLKELTNVGGKKAASGNGYFQGNFQGLEATVKSAARFPDRKSVV